MVVEELHFLVELGLDGRNDGLVVFVAERAVVGVDLDEGARGVRDRLFKDDVVGALDGGGDDGACAEQGGCGGDGEFREGHGVLLGRNVKHGRRPQDTGPPQLCEEV